MCSQKLESIKNESVFESIYIYMSCQKNPYKNLDDFDLKTKRSSLNLNFADYFGSFFYL
jgi:hypothetical protein